MPPEPPIAFVPEPEEVGLVVLINFGVFAGREVTPAEIDDLGRALVPELGQATVVAENRHELSGGRTEASLHQVRIEVPAQALPDDARERDWVRDWLVELSGRWARTCIEHRHADLVEPFSDEDSRIWEERNPRAVQGFSPSVFSGRRRRRR